MLPVKFFFHSTLTESEPDRVLNAKFMKMGKASGLGDQGFCLWNIYSSREVRRVTKALELRVINASMRVCPKCCGSLAEGGSHPTRGS